MCVCASHRVAAELMDDNAVGEGLIVRLDVQRPLAAVQRVLLDEVNVVHARDLNTTTALLTCRRQQTHTVRRLHPRALDAVDSFIHCLIH